MPAMRFPVNFYLAAVGKNEWRLLFPELFIGYVVWPLMTALLIGFTLYPFEVPAPTMAFGIVGGVLLSMTGAVVCGVTVTQVGATAGIVPLGSAFGVGYALLINMAGGLAPILARVKETDIAIVVLGNIASLVAPTAQIIVPLCLAIFATSYLMANNDSSPRAKSFKVWIGGVVAGMMIAGSLIGLVVGLTQIMTNIVSDIVAFCLAFGVIGSAAFGLVIKLKTASWKRGLFFGVIYSLVACGSSKESMVQEGA
jgi:hypothetical protein